MRLFEVHVSCNCNSTSRNPDDLYNINDIYVERMVHRIYPAEFQLNKANSFDTEAPFLCLNFSISNGICMVSIKMYHRINRMIPMFT